MSERIIVGDAVIQRTVTRIAHEVLEYNRGTGNLVLLSIKTRGEYLASRVQDRIHQIEQQRIPTGTINITCFRDDIEHMSSLTIKDAIDIDTDIIDEVVIIIDDVLYTCRTVCASFDAILLNARPIKIGLAALVDRGHRELPVRTGFVGKNILTSKEETVSVYLEEMDQENTVMVKQYPF